MKATRIIAFGVALIAGAGIYVFNKKSKGVSVKSAAEPKCETLIAPISHYEPGDKKPKRRLHTRAISRVENNLPKVSECNNFFNLPDGIIVVTNEGISDALDTVYQKGQAKRHVAKVGRKHRGGSSMKNASMVTCPIISVYNIWHFHNRLTEFASHTECLAENDYGRAIILDGASRFLTQTPIYSSTPITTFMRINPFALTLSTLN